MKPQRTLDDNSQIAPASGDGKQPAIKLLLWSNAGGHRDMAYLSSGETIIETLQCLAKNEKRG